MIDDNIQNIQNILCHKEREGGISNPRDFAPSAVGRE